LAGAKKARLNRAKLESKIRHIRQLIVYVIDALSDLASAYLWFGFAILFGFIQKACLSGYPMPRFFKLEQLNI
jgi:hypothetical protein